MVKLTIPTLFISVPCEERKQGNGQDIMDRTNRAVMWNWGKLIVVADHNYKGFSRINRTAIGKTRAYFGSKRFLCDVSEVGHIRTSDAGNRLYTASWRPVHEMWRDGLCLYTCIQKSAPDVMDVRLTHWREIT